MASQLFLLAAPGGFLLAVPGGWELWIILLILLLLFGRRIPQVARSLGQGISQFKKGLSDTEDELEDVGRLPEEESRKDREASRERDRTAT